MIFNKNVVHSTQNMPIIMILVFIRIIAMLIWVTFILFVDKAFYYKMRLSEIMDFKRNEKKPNKVFDCLKSKQSSFLRRISSLFLFIFHFLFSFCQTTIFIHLTLILKVGFMSNHFKQPVFFLFSFSFAFYMIIKKTNQRDALT